ncbi:MAG: TetR/AcrR family transcriptional regulator [Emcibacter sp.]|nr:TetR/AcrR family transcriptional regulator [Emcibacter sp.]
MPLNRKNMSADMRRAVTVKAVIELAAIQNPSDITTAAIARHMNVTQGALFRHFANKEAIWQAVIEWVTDHLLKQIDNSANAADTPISALRAIFMTHIDFVTSHPGVPRMMFGEMQHSEDTAPKKSVCKLIKKYGQRVISLIEQGKHLGEIDPTVDPMAAQTMFMGCIQGLVIQSLLVGEMENMTERAPKVFDIYIRGIENK